MIDPDMMDNLLEWMRKKFGKYRGKVADNKDGLNRGRLQVEVPSVLGKEKVWAEPCVPYAGDQVGFFAMPPVGAGVWVEFEGGDVSFPIWVGCYWRDNEPPHGGDPEIKMLRTTSITLMLDDGTDEARLENSSNASFTMKDKVETVAGTGKHTVAAGQVTAESGAKGKVDVTSSGTIVNNGELEVS